MTEKKTADKLAVDRPVFGDTTGGERLRGTRHAIQEEGAGLVDQDKNLKEAEKNDGRAPQADYGFKAAGASPANKAEAAESRSTK